jgi:CubicO group peptidase (beta-lactamase class C family)
MKKKLFRFILIIIVACLIYGGYYVYQAIPIITAYGAKNLCSCVFVAGRNPEQVIDQELGTTLSSLGDYQVNLSDRSATGTVFGLFTRKAIFRPGLGCTLVNGIDEKTLRDQNFDVAKKAVLNQDTIDWPDGNRTSIKIPANVDTASLNRVIRDAFAEPGPDDHFRTRAIIVVYRDTIIAEHYADGFNAATPLMGWSMTKSLTNAFVGILAGKNNLDMNVPAQVEGWEIDARKNITLNNLMHASSGLDWNEFYGGPSDATNMLFKVADAGGYAAQSPAKQKPDSQFYYSSGTTNIISKIVRHAIGDGAYHSFPYRELFHKIGMENTTIEPDPSGTFVGSSFSYAPARDWARFGLLYLHDGIWNGERILPDGWVKYTSTPAPAAIRGEYGAQWWLNHGSVSNPENRTYPDVPNDSFQCEGFEGQYVFVIPSKDLVVVRLGLSQQKNFDMNKLVSSVIAAIR